MGTAGKPDAETQDVATPRTKSAQQEVARIGQAARSTSAAWPKCSTSAEATPCMQEGSRGWNNGNRCAPICVPRSRGGGGCVEDPASPGVLVLDARIEGRMKNAIDQALPGRSATPVRRGQAAAKAPPPAMPGAFCAPACRSKPTLTMKPPCGSVAAAAAAPCGNPQAHEHCLLSLWRDATMRGNKQKTDHS